MRSRSKASYSARLWSFAHQHFAVAAPEYFSLEFTGSSAYCPARLKVGCVVRWRPVTKRTHPCLTIKLYLDPMSRNVGPINPANFHFTLLHCNLLSLSYRARLRR